MSEAIKNSQMQVCPQCDNHCPVTALRCGNGRKYFGAEDNVCGHEHGHGHHHGHGGEKHCHRHEGRGK